MSVLQGSVTETMNDGSNPSWEPARDRAWDELSDIEKADRVAKRLLGPPEVAAGIYVSIHAEENLWTGDFVVLDLVGGASKWNGVGLPSGIAIRPIGRGCFGWIQT